MKHFRPTLTALLLAAALHADVTLPAVLSDHMVVQRNIPVHIWGKAAPGEAVAVTFRGNTQSTRGDDLGRWTVSLPPGEPGGPFPLSIKANNTIAFDDILVGDVWVAGGQSNMEWPLSRNDNAQNEISAANHPTIRRVRLAHKTSDFPLTDATLEPWTAITPQTAGRGSAVAYFFARHLQERQPGIPVGLIESNWGGTAVEPWTSLGALASDSVLMPVIANWARNNDNYPTTLARYQQRLATWTEQNAKAKAEGRPETPRPAPPVAPGGRNTPGVLYNAMIAPIVPYPIKGVIWYQGESNANPTTGPLYARAFQTMIRDWRRAWGMGDFPFLFVQLPNFKANGYWPELREAQRQALQLPNVGMAIAIDIGDPGNLHPTNKQDPARRLALVARAVAYGERITYSGPLFRQASRDGVALRVSFDQTANGLTAKGGPPKGFEIAGADRKYVPADAKIDGPTVLVSSASVAEPVYVRYAWADVPDGNLQNSENLPAAPFRSEP